MAIQIQPLDLATVYGNVNAIQNQQQQNKLLGLQTQQIQQQMANTQRINPLLSQLDLSGGLQGNQETLQAITGIDPQMGLQLQQSFLQMDAQQQAQARETLQTGQRFLAGILALPAEQQQQAYLAGLPAMEQMGVTGLPDQFDPAAAQAAYTNIADLGDLFDQAKPQTDIGKLFADHEAGFINDATFNREIQNRYASSSPTPYTDIGKANSDLQNGLITPQQHDQIVLGSDGMDLKDVVSSENTLRDDYEGRSKDFFTINDAYKRIKSAGQEPSAAGDLALIFSFMKILDPGSTVREGEFANAQNAGGVDDRIRGLYNQIRSGELLSEAQRADFLAQTESLYGAAVDTQRTVNNTYSGIAERYGFNPQNVVTFNLPDAVGGDIPNTTGQEAAPTRTDGVFTGQRTPEGFPIYTRPDGTQFAVNPNG